MKIINQLNGVYGCGIAAFATAVGLKSYEAALSWMKKNDYCKENELVTLPQMQSALSKYLAVDIKKRCKIWSEEYTCLCYVRFKGKSGALHWVVYYEGQYYDPYIGNTHPTTETVHEISWVLQICS